MIADGRKTKSGAFLCSGFVKESFSRFVCEMKDRGCNGVTLHWVPCFSNRCREFDSSCRRGGKRPTAPISRLRLCFLVGQFPCSATGRIHFTLIDLILSFAADETARSLPTTSGCRMAALTSPDAVVGSGLARHPLLPRCSHSVDRSTWES